MLPVIPKEVMKQVILKETVEERIEALFDAMPDVDIPSAIVRMVSKEALDWQRALRRVRQKTGKEIVSTQKRTAYRYEKE